MNRIDWLNNSRIVAVFAVVMLHVSGIILVEKDFGSFDWWAGNLIDSSVRWSVPIFVMISGALLLGAKEPIEIKTFYNKRLARILYPLIFWSVFFLIWTCVKSQAKGDPIEFHSLFQRLIKGTPYYHMWFLYMIVPLYIFTPFLKKAVYSCSNVELNIFIISTFTISIIFTISETILAAVDSAIFISLFLQYIPYFLIGYKINNDNTSPPSRLVWIVLTSSILLTSVGYYWGIAYSNISISGYFYSYLSITVIPMSISVFYLLKKWNKPIFNYSFSSKISLLTLGVYLIHPAIIDIFRLLNFGPENFNPFFSVPALAILIVIIALTVCWVMSKTPFICKII